MKIRIINQIRNSIFKCRKEINKLRFDTKGNYKKGIDARDKLFARRLNFLLIQISMDKANGRYTQDFNKQQKRSQ